MPDPGDSLAAVAPESMILPALLAPCHYVKGTDTVRTISEGVSDCCSAEDGQ